MPLSSPSTARRRVLPSVTERSTAPANSSRATPRSPFIAIHVRQTVRTELLRRAEWHLLQIVDRGHNRQGQQHPRQRRRKQKSCIREAQRADKKRCLRQRHHYNRICECDNIPSCKTRCADSKPTSFKPSLTQPGSPFLSS